MAINEFNPTTFASEIAQKGQFKSDSFNAFTESVASDLSSLKNILNGYVINLIKTMPSDSTVLDASTLYVDSMATEDKDNGVFYFKHPSDSGQDRPLTIKDTLLLFLQIVNNAENAMREGVKIGSFSSKIAFAINHTRTYPWPYTDHAFKPVLYVQSGNNIREISDSQFDIYIDTSTADYKLNIKNISGDAIDIYGYVWHPVFTF